MFIYLSSRFTGRTIVQWLDKSGRLEPLMRKPAVYDWIRLSPDGGRIAVIEQGRTRDIWVYDLKRETMSRITPGGVNDMAIWSPDGNHLAYASSGQEQGLWWARADGSSERQRLSEIRWNPNSFSPDGKRVAASGWGAGANSDIWTLPLGEPESDRPKLGTAEPFLRAAAFAVLPAFSPDGRWLAYASDESGVSQVYVRPFPGPGDGWQISTEGGTNPIWSRTTQELFYISKGRRIMVSSYRYQAKAFVAENPLVWCDFQTLSPPQLPFYSSIIDLAPDGRRFAVLVSASTESQKPPTQVNVLLNFADELRRKIVSNR
jgi:serine/threonine-protein kinase